MLFVPNIQYYIPIPIFAGSYSLFFAVQQLVCLSYKPDNHESIFLFLYNHSMRAVTTRFCYTRYEA